MPSSLRFAAALLLFASCSAELVARLPSGAPVVAGEHDFVELNHQVGIQLRDGEAIYEVTRHWRNDGATTSELEHQLPLPAGAVVSALAVARGGEWQPADFLDAAVADDAWEQLLGPGDAPAQPLAMLSGQSGMVRLSLALVPAGDTVAVRYVIRTRATYARGEWSAYYPYEGDDAPFVPATVQWAESLDTRTQPCVDPTPADVPFGETEGDGAAAPVDPNAADGLCTTASAGHIDRLEAHWATFDLGPDRVAYRLELEAAVVPEPPPPMPTVVFAIDVSRSRSPAAIAAQLDMVGGYLDAAPTASFELIAYHRTAERLFGAFQPARDWPRLRASLDASRLVPANGSNLDAATRLAAQLLVGQPTPRLVLFTDDLLPDRIDAQVMRDAISTVSDSAVVHLVTHALETPATSLDKDETHRFAEALAMRGGVVTYASDESNEGAGLGQAMSYLVAPNRFDDLEIIGLDDLLAEDEPPPTTVLAAGAQIIRMGVSVSPPPTVLVRARLWQRVFERTVHVDPTAVAHLPARALGDTELAMWLDTDERRRLAIAARAVSNETSYLAAAPDAAASAERPQGDRLEGIPLVGSAFSVSRCGGVRVRFTKGASALQEQVVTAVDECRRALNQPDSIVRCQVELTNDELVDVKVTAADAAMVDCATEGLWRTAFHGHEDGHAHYEFVAAPNAPE